MSELDHAKKDLKRDIDKSLDLIKHDYYLSKTKLRYGLMIHVASAK